MSPPVTIIIPRLLVWAECNNNNPRLGSSASGVRSLGPELDSGGLERGSPSRPGAQCSAPQPAAKLQDTPANRKLQGKAKVHFRSDSDILKSKTQ